MIAIDNRTILAEDLPDAPSIVETIERSNSGRLKELLNKLVEKSQIAMVISGLNQKRINAATRHLETKVAEGLGEWVCRIDRLQFLAQQRIHGWNCWSDPEFIAAFLRDNPSYRLRYHARNYVAGWSRPEETSHDGHKGTQRKAPNFKLQIGTRRQSAAATAPEVAA